MANSLLTIDMITYEAARILANKLVVTGNVNRQYDSSFAKEGAKIGDTLRIRLPDRVTVRNGAALSVQAENQQYTTLSCNSQRGVDIAFSSAEQAMKLDNFSKLILEPRISQLAAQIDYEVASGVAPYIGQSVGTPGTTPATTLVLLAGNQKLHEAAAPDMARYCTVNPAANAALVEGMKGFFNPVGTISSQFKSGMMGQNVLGYDAIEMSQSISTFTCGSRTSTGGTTSAAVTTQGTTTVAITGAGASGTVKAGDVFTVASCFAVNPQTRVSTGSLYQFVAASDVTLDGSGAGNVTVRVPIYSADSTDPASKALAIVDTLPANAKAVVFMGTASTAYPQNLIYQRDAIAFVTADLVLPKGVAAASRVNHEGISLRIVQAYDVTQDREITRLDVLFGYGVIRPELACRLWG